MPFTELERIKSSALPQLAELFTALESFCGELLEKSSHPAATCDESAMDVTTELLAERLQIDDGLALVMLREVEKAGFATHRYHVLCPALDKLLARFQSVNELPEEIDCEFEEGRVHSDKEYFVELIFRLSPELLKTE